MLPLLPGERRVLRALVAGGLLRHHSDLEGHKWHALHAEGHERRVRAWTVSSLRARGLLLSNEKFPVSTYVLTGKGEEAARRLAPAALHPVTAHRPEDPR